MIVISCQICIRGSLKALGCDFSSFDCLFPTNCSLTWRWCHHLVLFITMIQWSTGFHRPHPRRHSISFRLSFISASGSSPPLLSNFNFRRSLVVLKRRCVMLVPGLLRYLGLDRRTKCRVRTREMAMDQ